MAYPQGWKPRKDVVLHRARSQRKGKSGYYDSHLTSCGITAHGNICTNSQRFITCVECLRDEMMRTELELEKMAVRLEELTGDSPIRTHAASSPRPKYEPIELEFSEQSEIQLRLSAGLDKSRKAKSRTTVSRDARC